MCRSASSRIIENIHLARAISFSSYALLVWDYLLTLDDEMTYIWKSPFSVVKCFFIGNRYLNLFVQPVSMCQVAGILPLRSKEACFAFSLAVGLYQFWSYGSVHYLVLLRVWILNGRTRKITIALAAVLAFYLCAYVALLAYILHTITFNLHATSAGSCGGRLAPFSWLIWIVEFLLEACLFSLTILTLSLYIHAIIFFLANTLGDITNTIAWTVFLRTPLYHIANTFPIALVNITGQRLAIDLRRLHIRKDVTQSEVSREVELQLAAFDVDSCVVP